MKSDAELREDLKECASSPIMIHSINARLKGRQEGRNQTLKEVEEIINRFKFNFAMEDDILQEIQKLKEKKE